MFDLPNEEIGFKNEIITLDSSKTENFISLFEEESELQFIVKSEHKYYGKIDFTLNSPTKDLNIIPLNKTFNEQLENWSIMEANNSGDSVTLWLYPEAFDKEIELLIKDGNEIIDTVNFEVIAQSKLKDSTLSVSSNVSSSFGLDRNIRLTINHPFTKYSSNNIKLYEDSKLVSITSFTDIGLREFELAYDFKENTSYQLFIPKNSFDDIYGLTNDTIKLDFKTKKESDYGIINLNIIPKFSENYIIQISKNKKIITESHLTGTQEIHYKYLSPGVYSIKLIIDSNGDKKWSTGNYLEGLQPEKVIIYNKEIKIRANWDNDIKWIIKE